MNGSSFILRSLNGHTSDAEIKKGKQLKEKVLKSIVN